MINFGAVPEYIIMTLQVSDWLASDTGRPSFQSVPVLPGNVHQLSPVDVVGAHSAAPVGNLFTVAICGLHWTPRQIKSYLINKQLMLPSILQYVDGRSFGGHRRAIRSAI